MLSRATLTVGIFAVLAGLLAAYGVRSYLNQELETLPPVAETVVRVDRLKVPVAGENLPADRVVHGTDIVLLALTHKQVEEKFPGVDPQQVLLNLPAIINRRLKDAIPRGQPFLTTKFYLDGTGPSIAKRLPPGFRAIRVHVPETHEAGVQEGMRVDVYFRANARPAKGGQPAIPEKTLTLLRNIEVLDAERAGPVGAGKGKAAARAKQPLLFTLAVPEAKADMFGVIEGRGDLWLVPTPAADKDQGGGQTAEVSDASTLAELLGLKPLRETAPPFETTVYRRGHREVNRFVEGKLVANRAFNRGPAPWDHESPAAPGTLPAVVPTFETPEAPQSSPAPAQDQ